jgi:hypothetical protein
MNFGPHWRPWTWYDIFGWIRLPGYPTDDDGEATGGEG